MSESRIVANHLCFLGELSQDLRDMERGIEGQRLRHDQVVFLREITEEILARTLAMLSPECRAYYGVTTVIREEDRG